MTIREAHEIRRNNQQSAIQTLEKHFTRDAIGRMCGYKDRQMTDRVMADTDQVMNGDAELILVRAASELGNDGPADSYSADSKINVPIRWNIDGNLSQELREIMQGAGIGSAAFEGGDGHAAISASEQLVRGALGFRTETIHRFAPMQMNHVCGDLFR
jgi:hypothetical protein